MAQKQKWQRKYTIVDGPSLMKMMFSMFTECQHSDAVRFLTADNGPSIGTVAISRMERINGSLADWNFKGIGWLSDVAGAVHVEGYFNTNTRKGNCTVTLA